MDFGNLVEIVVHYLIIREMICLGCPNGVPMVNILVYIVTHWIGLTVNHYVRLLDFLDHQATMLHRLSTLREYLAYVEINMRL